MQAQIKEEYLSIRRELTEIKNCMTTYIGFVIGGSGLAFYLIFSSANFNKQKPLLSILFALLALIIQLVLVVLTYKFNSHNRYAGYCKLLGHEILVEKKLEEKNIDYLFGWERCMAELRMSDRDNKPVIEMIGKLNVKNINKEKLELLLLACTGRMKTLDRSNTRNGLKILWKGTLWKLDSASWRFPIFIVLIFNVLTAICYASSVAYLTYYLIENDICKIDSLILSSVWLLLSFLIFQVMRYPIQKLHNLMEGSATVDRFCWKFLPFRIQFLNKMDITPTYLLGDALDNILNEISNFIKKNKKAEDNLPDKLKKWYENENTPKKTTKKQN